MPLRQRGDRGRGAGHDAPQQREGPPVADTLLPLVHGLSGLDDLGAEVIGLAEEFAVIARKPVGLVAGFALGEAVLAFPVLLDVAARALDEMLRELDSLGLGERGRVPLAKSSRSSESSERKESSIPLCGVAVSRMRCRSSCRAISRTNWWRCCWPWLLSDAAAEPWASSTITRSGQSSKNRWRLRSLLTKSMLATWTG